MNFHSLFPVLEKYTYLNTAYSGLLAVDTAEWRANHDKEFVAGGSEFRERSVLLIDELRDNISDLFGSQKDNTFLVPNFSFGFNILLSGLHPSHRFLLLKEDYPSIVDPVARMGFEHRDVVIDENMEANILDTIKTFKPTIFAFSMVQYISGFKMDDTFLLKIKSDNPDILLIADGTQFTGTTNFNFATSGLDALIGSGYKWLLGGYGNGYVFLSDQMKDVLDEKINDRASTMTSAENKINVTPLFEPGHLDSLNFGTLNQSIHFLRNLGLDFIEKTNGQLCNTARHSFYEKGLLPRWMYERRQQSTIVNLPLADDIIERIEAAGILGARRGKGLRFSFHFYNTENELQHLLNALEQK